jgi:hypothetical protein
LVILSEAISPTPCLRTTETPELAFVSISKFKTSIFLRARLFLNSFAEHVMGVVCSSDKHAQLFLNSPRGCFAGSVYHLHNCCNRAGQKKARKTQNSDLMTPLPRKFLGFLSLLLYLQRKTYAWQT